MPRAEFASGLISPECPRWHAGSLWLSDMGAHEVLRFQPDGTRHLVHRFPEEEEPGGLGWLPDGSMLVVGMEGRVVYRLLDGKAAVHADLRAMAPFQANDMIVGADGVAYVSHFGFDLHGGGERKSTILIRVAPDGTPSAAAQEMQSPNGLAISEDGRTLVVAEPGAGRISWFTIADGCLRDRVSLSLEKAPGAARVTPDGICLDSASGVWIADPYGRRLIHLDGAGKMDRTVPIEKGYPLACVLGVAERRMLFVCMADHISRGKISGRPSGRVIAFEVGTPGQGRP
jgi:sugar lactone lactonase YvrE